ncbi:STAS domain-containing protein [Kitasatospora sp. NPDC127060]
MEDDGLLRTRTDLCQDTASVSLEGELDIATAPLVGEAVARALAERPHRLDLDVAALTFCDAAGVRALVRTRRACHARDTQFRLVGVRPKLRRILALLRVPELLTAPPGPVGSPAGAVPPEPVRTGVLSPCPSSAAGRLLPKESMS